MFHRKVLTLSQVIIIAYEGCYRLINNLCDTEYSQINVIQCFKAALNARIILIVIKHNYCKNMKQCMRYESLYVSGSQVYTTIALGGRGYFTRNNMYYVTIG